MGALKSVTDVLQLFVDGHDDVGVAGLSEALGWPKSSSSRVLAQMADVGLLERDPVTRRYRLGALVTALSHAQRQSMSSVQRLSHDVLVDVCARTGHAASLSILAGTDTLLLEQFTGFQPLQAMSYVGSRLPASVTAMGRVLLSRLSQEEFDSRYGVDRDRALPSSRPRCPQTVGELGDRVSRARQERFELAVDEGLPGVGAVATTLCDPQSHTTIGLAVSFPAHQVEDVEVARIRTILLTAVASVGQKLGDHWWTEGTSSLDTGVPAQMDVGAVTNRS